MKKIIVALLSLTLLFVLASCGNSDSNDSTKEDSKEESSTPTVYFKDDVLKLKKATIELTDGEFITPNTYSEQENEILMFTFNITNTSAGPLDPIEVWTESFFVTQDFENETKNGDLPIAGIIQDGQLKTTGEQEMELVEPGETVQAIIAYDLLDSTPIQLIATRGGRNGEILGGKRYTPMK